MSHRSTKSRRRFLYNLGAAGIGLTAAMSNGAASEACKVNLTPRQPEGPFYPVDERLNNDNDLTQVDGKSEVAKGQKIYIKGIVTDQNCAPVENALVEIWQACESGRYDHPGDSNNSAPLDPNFQYWGQMATKVDGSYIFKTVIPGSYAASASWIRPPHIHYKVSAKGYRELITQMYFVGQKYNDSDLILNDLSAEDQSQVVVNLTDSEEGMDPTAMLAIFHIQIQKI